MKHGYRTSEFYLTLVACVVGALLGSGWIVNDTALQGLGIMSSALAALGYTGGRAFTKSANSKAEAIKSLPKD